MYGVSNITIWNITWIRIAKWNTWENNRKSLESRERCFHKQVLFVARRSHSDEEEYWNNVSQPLISVKPQTVKSDVYIYTVLQFKTLENTFCSKHNFSNRALCTPLFLSFKMNYYTWLLKTCTEKVHQPGTLRMLISVHLGHSYFESFTVKN